jgi:hypothetical protein
MHAVAEWLRAARIAAGFRRTAPRKYLRTAFYKVEVLHRLPAAAHRHPCMPWDMDRVMAATIGLRHSLTLESRRTVQPSFHLGLRMWHRMFLVEISCRYLLRTQVTEGAALSTRRARETIRA